MGFKWDESFEAGLPSDKEIITKSQEHRLWVVQEALCRVMVEVMEHVELASKIPPSTLPGHRRPFPVKK